MTRQYFDMKEVLLENGIQLVTIKKDSKLASIHVGIKMGALWEKLNEKGICHFIEHMLFKGTKNRDNNQINQQLEERAGSYNAYTDYTSTVFTVTALAEELEASTEIIADMMMRATFPEDEIERERGVILAEYKTSMDDVEQYSFQKAHELAFNKSPLRYDVIGTEDNIKAFTKEQLKQFYQKHYIPNRCVISIVSPMEHETIEAMIKQYFGDWKQGAIDLADIVIEKHLSLQKTTYKKHIEQSTLIYLYTFHGLSRMEELALEILNHKLGESANSILFRALREEKGIAYDVYSEMDATEYIKVLTIYTSVGEEDVFEAKSIIEGCIHKIKTREICLDEKNIQLMKRVIKTAVASMLEDSSELANYVVHQKLAGKKIDGFVDDLAAMEKIHAEDIYQVAETVLKKPMMHILMSG
ncbi:M16 family metallopeptidase [Geosporobacter ferrireducens]|uniref:Peptidase M16 n=1 Tax=Geosporobacter ferrireducens TaxID=1424294 RepID=A0A1D8GNW0_9FIRM|nr:pitrilysin family protein [Geosporobacter ferrireducens]AOT72620.1 peptidase M16 [Geosporobacter ferrireducens]MTI55022.1 insulinase family protein [Geosporobacter ferrireducens]